MDPETNLHSDWIGQVCQKAEKQLVSILDAESLPFGLQGISSLQQSFSAGGKGQVVAENVLYLTGIRLPNKLGYWAHPG